MPKKNQWIGLVEKLLKNQALSSTELAYRIKQHYRRISPHARDVTLVLKNFADKFQIIEETKVSSTISSHQVKLWGLKGYTYDSKYPHFALEGADF